MTVSEGAPRGSRSTFCSLSCRIPDRNTTAPTLHSTLGHCSHVTISFFIVRGVSVITHCVQHLRALSHSADVGHVRWLLTALGAIRLVPHLQTLQQQGPHLVNHALSTPRPPHLAPLPSWDESVVRLQLQAVRAAPCMPAACLPALLRQQARLCYCCAGQHASTNLCGGIPARAA